MKKLDYLKPKTLSRQDELRFKIAQIDASIGAMSAGQGREILAILPLFDEAHATYAQLQAEGRGLQVEKALLDEVSAKLKAKAGLFLREVGGAAALQEARQMRTPGPDEWWWYLDQYWHARRRAQGRRIVQISAIVVAVLLLLVAVERLFLAPDPLTSARIRHEQTAESLLMSGDLPGALAETEQALAANPGDAELLVLRGVIQQMLGQSQEAERTFAQAAPLFPTPDLFFLARGHRYLFLNQPELALADAQMVVSQDGDSARGYLLLAQAYETSGDISPAILAYEQASALANEQGDPQTAAMARVLLGFLMQRLPVETEINQ